VTEEKAPWRVAGVDVGGTKVRILSATRDAPVTDTTIDNLGWLSLDDRGRAQSLTALIKDNVEDPGALAALVVGVSGADSSIQRRILQDALREQVPHALVVNDSQLVVPAEGVASGTGVIAGTGSSASSRDAEGNLFTVGGWGWFIGDEGGATGIVREAAREVLDAYDTDDGRDPLSPILLAALHVTHPHAMSQVFTKIDPRTWAAQGCPAVFRALEEGSERARRVIAHQARGLAALVRVVDLRGGDTSTIVTAGGVITHQPVFLDAFTRAVHVLTHRSPRITLLAHPPAQGAIELAGRIASRRQDKERP
jgi:N-acetylglucosamine kinase-like BadF-type ATPase